MSLSYNDPSTSVRLTKQSLSNYPNFFAQTFAPIKLKALQYTLATLYSFANTI